MRARSGWTPLDTGCNAHPMYPKLELKLPDQMGTARRAGGKMFKGSYNRLGMNVGARPGPIPLHMGCKARPMHLKLGLTLPDRMERKHRHNTELTSNTLTKGKGEDRQEAKCPRS